MPQYQLDKEYLHKPTQSKVVYRGEVAFMYRFQKDNLEVFEVATDKAEEVIKELPKPSPPVG